MSETPHPDVILLAEDDSDDRLLLKDAMAECSWSGELHCVENGEELLDYLLRRGQYQPPAQAPRPGLILLDLNMPRKDGREVLAEVKGDPDLKRIPVVILTVSQAEQDILESYNLHANCYITKPVDLDRFLTVVKSIEDFWLTIVKLPPAGRPMPDGGC